MGHCRLAVRRDVDEEVMKRRCFYVGRCRDIQEESGGTRYLTSIGGCTMVTFMLKGAISYANAYYRKNKHPTQERGEIL